MNLNGNLPLCPCLPCIMCGVFILWWYSYELFFYILVDLFNWCRLDDTEKIEDEFTGLKVISFGENCIRLSLRTYIPKLEELLPQQKIADAIEPSHVNHELLIELLEGTLDLRNVEVSQHEIISTYFLHEYCFSIAFIIRGITLTSKQL